ncbi:hypothetical protein [Lonepinella sp. MS14437]|uniref:hypothetical protein n=1 Tax=Lonepinella sp. MS14437 TaxID=3003620 RepID=UPI0036DE1341
MPTFNLNSDDLQPVIDILDEALLNRPEPIGIPHYDIDSAIASAREYSDAIDELSDPDIQLDAWDLQHLAQSMANGYKEFWESPFPIGLETGQILFSAILEKPMRELSRNLKKILRNLEIDDNNPLINIDAEKEVDAFNEWLETTQTTNKSNKSSCCGWILAAGLFGYWLGN